MSTPFIETRELKFSYDDIDSLDKKQNYALRGVSTVIDRGEYVAVVGRNGSGKSTFAKLLNLVLEPTSGDVLIDGKFVLEKKSLDVKFRGSTNQRILDVKASLEKQEAVRIEKYI